MHFNAEWALMLLTIPGAKNWHARSTRFRIELELKLAEYRGAINRRLRRTGGPGIEFDDLSPTVVDRSVRRFGVVANSFYAFPPSFVWGLFRSARSEIVHQRGHEHSANPLPIEEAADREFDDDLFLDLREFVGWTRDEFSALAHWLFDQSKTLVMDPVTEQMLRNKFVDAAGGENREDRHRNDHQLVLNDYLQGWNQQEIADRHHVSLATVHRRLNRAAIDIADRLRDPSLEKWIHELSERWSKRARPSSSSRKTAPTKPIDFSSCLRWYSFHQRLLVRLCPFPLRHGVALFAPVFSVTELETYVAQNDPELDLEIVLRQIHDAAMEQFTPNQVAPAAIAPGEAAAQ